MTPDRPLTAAQADHLINLIQAAIEAAHDQGSSIYRDDLTAEQRRTILSAYTGGSLAAYQAVHALRRIPEDES